MREGAEGSPVDPDQEPRSGGGDLQIREREIVKECDGGNKFVKAVEISVLKHSKITSGRLIGHLVSVL